jgi:hypothetical protein
MLDIRSPKLRAALCLWLADVFESSCLKSTKRTGMLRRNPGASPPYLYFAPRCHNTTFAVSKRMARSKVKERCLM